MDELIKHTVYECNIDNRMVLCSCGRKKCKIGMNFDSNPEIIRLTDMYGNEHTMYLSTINIEDIINILLQSKININKEK